MNIKTKERILKKLEKAKDLVNDAFELLNDEEQEKCDVFAGLICDIDEATGEVENLEGY